MNFIGDNDANSIDAGTTFQVNRLQGYGGNDGLSGGWLRDQITAEAATTSYTGGMEATNSTAMGMTVGGATPGRMEMTIWMAAPAPTPWTEGAETTPCMVETAPTSCTQGPAPTT